MNIRTRDESAKSKSQQHAEAVAETNTTPERDGLSPKARIQLKAKSGKKSQTQPEKQPKNGRSISIYHENVLAEKDRKPQFIGTAINVPFLVEDFRLIDKAFNTENIEDCSTLTAYIRHVLLERAEQVLSPEEYAAIKNYKLNLVTEAKE